MKIESLNFKYQINNSCNLQKYNTRRGFDTFSRVSFDARPVMPQINLEKKSLIERIADLLRKNEKDDNKSAASLVALIDKTIKFAINRLSQLKQIDKQMEDISSNMFLSRSQKISMMESLFREAKRINRLVPNFLIKQKNNQEEPDERLDCVLLNKFKSAIIDGQYNLEKVFNEHYKLLKGVQTIKELNKKYPAIKTPERPEDVVAKRIVHTIGKDFFVKLNELRKNTDKDGAKILFKELFNSLKDSIFTTKAGVLSEDAQSRIKSSLIKQIMIKYKEIMEKGILNSLPDKRKIKQPLITENDFKLLSVNYDDFVLYVIKEQYLNKKNPADVVYENNGIKIKVSSLKEREYKFEKIHNNIKQLLAFGKQLLEKDRRYEDYTPNDFQAKLEFYLNKIEDEHLLEKIIEFDSCRYTEDDNIQLSKLLREFDQVFDGQKSEKEVSEYVQNENIQPIGTKHLTEIELQQGLEKAKIEQKNMAKLRSMQEHFDALINELYTYGLNYAADISSKYRPVSLEQSDLSYELILKTIETYKKNKLSKEDLQMALIDIDKYLEYKKSNIHKDIVDKAEAYSISENGKLDERTAGLYIKNTEIVNVYEQNPKLLEITELMQKILDIFNNDKVKAVEYLCKYDKYSSLADNKKDKIAEILNIFDYKQSAEDKIILKYILENDYINRDTNAFIVQNGQKPIKTTITSKAKKEIYDYYNFPECVRFFKGFEEAMTIFAKNEQSSGIKGLQRNNNSLSGMSELKIAGEKDRLFAYDGTYYFDEFSRTGRHK